MSTPLMADIALTVFLVFVGWIFFSVGIASKAQDFNGRYTRTIILLLLIALSCWIGAGIVWL